MPLNHNSGELLEGMGALYRVAPTDKWASTPLFAQAVQAATKAYRKAENRFCEDGQMDVFKPHEILCQEYPLTDHLVILFCRKLKSGEEMFYPYTFKLHPQLVARMVVDGMWDSTAPKAVIH